MRKYILLLITTVFFGQIMLSQEEKVDDFAIKIEKINSRKGQFFVSWGWNRSFYSKSDIHFKGENYDFTLHDVKAKDRPNPFGIKFLSPGDLTLPATNAKLGYFIKDNYNIVIGLDHMKYVMRQNLDVKIDGTINIGDYDFEEATYNYDGNYNGNTINLEPSFLQFEHTDGLNYIYVGLNRFDNFNKLLHINTRNFEVNLEEGVDVGLLYPKTNTTLLGKDRHDDFHVSGFGFSIKAGLNLTFFKHFYLQSDFKMGYINMPKIRTTNDAVDSAKQHFTYHETMYTFGYRFSLF